MIFIETSHTQLCGHKYTSPEARRSRIAGGRLRRQGARPPPLTDLPLRQRRQELGPLAVARQLLPEGQHPLRPRPRLGVDVNIMLTRPCIFYTENRYKNVRGGVPVN